MSSEAGTLIRYWRLRAGLTQEDLADRSHLSVRTIRDIEMGRSRRPYRRTLEQIAAALELNAATTTDLTRHRPARDAQGHPHSCSQEAMPTTFPFSAVARGYAAMASPSPRPAQLPADLAHFVGRDDVLQQCDQELLVASCQQIGRGKVIQLFGPAGIGKSALAVHWAHRAAGRFHDGQLYVDLQGHHVTESLRPATVLRRFLRALGVQQSALPESSAELAALYRSKVAGRNVLILLDNARSAEQVRPLLPNTPSCAVVVTTRARLTGLNVKDGAHPIKLDWLPDCEAIQLLTSIVGTAYSSAAPDALLELVEQCAGLPLAIQIIGERVAGHPGTALARLSEAVRTDTLNLLDSPEDASVGVRSALSSSYLHLSERSARLFRLLSLQHGPELSLLAAAEMAGVRDTSRGVRRLQADLEALVHVHLIESPEPDQYRFHPLIRLYAAERAAIEEGKHEREQTKMCTVSPGRA
jgi:DNA-binding XRE family transcriptional regulator